MKVHQPNLPAPEFELKSMAKSKYADSIVELSPNAIRLDQFKFVFNLRGDDAAQTGGLAVDTNLGWKGRGAYVATVPQVFDLRPDPQDRYDIFMTNFTETTWLGPIMNDEPKKAMESYVNYPPRKLQGVGYTGPITIRGYQRFEWVRRQLASEGVRLTLQTGN